MKVWIDDEREAPSGWIWIKHPGFAISFIRESWNKIEEISLDHDLGYELTGYDIVKDIEQVGHNIIVPFVIRVHSMNPVGRSNMLAGIGAIYNRNFEVMDELDPFDD